MNGLGMRPPSPYYMTIPTSFKSMVNDTIPVQRTINEALGQSQETWLPLHLYSPLVSCISDMARPTS